MDAYLALLLGGMGWAMIIVATGTPWSSGRVLTIQDCT